MNAYRFKNKNDIKIIEVAAILHNYRVRFDCNHEDAIGAFIYRFPNTLSLFFPDSALDLHSKSVQNYHYCETIEEFLEKFL